MISAVTGSVFEITPGVLHLDTGTGFILRLQVPVSDFSKLKSSKKILLYTVLKIKEDAVVLYGFLTRKEKQFFEKLTTISGVGGKIALSLIAAFTLDEMIAAINNGDVEKITSIPGVGKKTAQRIVLELTGKLDFRDGEVEEITKLKEDLISGLANLGYPVKSVRQQVNQYIRDRDTSAGFEDMFKDLLKKISNV